MLPEIVKAYHCLNFMNRGFSLIEIIVYIALLALLIVGVSSSILSFVYSSMNRPAFSVENYELLIENYHEN